MSGKSRIGSENSATSWPSVLPILAYLVIVLIARADRSKRDTISSFISPSPRLPIAPFPRDLSRTRHGAATPTGGARACYPLRHAVALQLALEDTGHPMLLCSAETHGVRHPRAD